MRIGKYLLAGILCWGGIELGESLLLSKTACAEESWEAAARKLTPKLYRRNSDKFEDHLQTLQRFLWDKSQSQENREITLESLVSNISLSGDSLPHAMETSEKIRDILVREGVLDFKKKLEDLANDVSYETGMIQALERFSSSSGLNNFEARKNTGTAKGLIEIRRNYRAALQQEAELLKQAMFLFRWHYPPELKGKIDYKNLYKKCRETLSEISQLSKAVAERNFYGIAKHLAGHNEKYREAQSYFARNLDLARGHAETTIELNIAALKKVGYGGKLFLATKKFAYDWEDIGGAVSLVRVIQKGGKPETIKPPRVASRTKDKPRSSRTPTIQQPHRERTSSTQQTGVRWTGLPSRAELERRLDEILSDKGIAKLIPSKRDINMTINMVDKNINGKLGDCVPSFILCDKGLLASYTIPKIRQNISPGNNITNIKNALEYLNWLGIYYNFNEQDKKYFTDAAIRNLGSSDLEIKALSLDALYYLEYPRARRLARKFIYHEDSNLQKTAVSILARLQDSDIQKHLFHYKKALRKKTIDDYDRWAFRNKGSILLLGNDEAVGFMEGKEVRDLGLRTGRLLSISAKLLRDFNEIYNDSRLSSREKIEKLAEIVAYRESITGRSFVPFKTATSSVISLHANVTREIDYKMNRLPPEAALVVYDMYRREPDQEDKYGPSFSLNSHYKRKAYAKLIVDLLDELALKGRR